jgi:hypothetical protein
VIAEKKLEPIALPGSIKLFEPEPEPETEPELEPDDQAEPTAGENSAQSEDADS